MLSLILTPIFAFLLIDKFILFCQKRKILTSDNKVPFGIFILGLPILISISSILIQMLLNIVPMQQIDIKLSTLAVGLVFPIMLKFIALSGFIFVSVFIFTYYSVKKFSYYFKFLLYFVISFILCFLLQKEMIILFSGNINFYKPFFIFLFVIIFAMFEKMNNVNYLSISQMLPNGLIYYFSVSIANMISMFDKVQSHIKNRGIDSFDDLNPLKIVDMLDIQLFALIISLCVPVLFMSYKYLSTKNIKCDTGLSIGLAILNLIIFIKLSSYFSFFVGFLTILYPMTEAVILFTRRILKKNFFQKEYLLCELAIRNMTEYKISKNVFILNILLLIFCIILISFKISIFVKICIVILSFMICLYIILKFNSKNLYR